jgi:hypothetical protein
MAQRRGWQRALAGVGEGISNAATFAFRQRQADQQQDRYDARAAANQQAMDERAAAAQVAAAERAIDEKVATGALDPAQADAMKQRLRGQSASSEAIRPSPRRRVEKAVGEGIDAAKSPGEVDSPESILSKFFAQGVDPQEHLPPEWSAGLMPADDPYAGGTPLVREYGARAQTKRRALQEADTDLIDTEDPITGAKGKRRVPKSSSELATGLTTGPTAAQAGALKGAEEVAATEVAGPSRSAQGAAEAGATAAARQAVEMSPEAVSARTREAVNKEVATLKATMPLQLELAGKKAAAEIAQAVNKDNAQQTNAASRAAQELAPFFAKVTDLTKGLNNREGIGARVKGTSKVAASYLGMAPEVTELNQLISQNLRKLAIAQGVREANVSEKETAQALQGIGLYAWSTATERRNALRNLSDMITLGPVVASRAPADATIGERMQLAQSLVQQRRAVEAKAIELGADMYRDPVLGMLVQVIK